jgi:hypothetical protein
MELAGEGKVPGDDGGNADDLVVPQRAAAQHVNNTKACPVHHRRHGIGSQISPQALRGFQRRATVFIVVIMVTYRYAPVSMTNTRPEWGPTAVMSVGEYRLLSAILGMDYIHV